MICIQCRKWLMAMSLVSCLAAAGCDGIVDVKGAVVDRNGDPIELAAVTLLYPDTPADDLTRYTPEDGTFSFHRTCPPRATLVLAVARCGFKPVARSVDSTQRIRDLTVRLEEEVVPE